MPRSYLTAMLTTVLSLAMAAPSLAALTLTSAAFSDGQTIPAKYAFNSFGCTGQNVSPPLTWSGAPSGTKSFVLIEYDPKAPTGVGWFHWIAFNIPASASALPEGAGAVGAANAPSGMTDGFTDFGAPGYGGMCPPTGDAPHPYTFTLYAIDAAQLPYADATTTGAKTGYVLNGHVLAKASLTGLFGR